MPQFQALRKQAEKEKSEAIERIVSMRRKLEEEEASMNLARSRKHKASNGNEDAEI